MTARDTPATPARKEPTPRWRLQVNRHPSAILLMAQLVGLLLYPFIEGKPWGSMLFGTFSVIVLNIPNIQVIANVDLGDIVVQNRNVVAQSVITQVAVATTVGITVCGFCLGGSPQVVGTAFAFGGHVSWPGLR